MKHEYETIKEMLLTHPAGYESEIDSALAAVVILATFEHDYMGTHFLVQQWDRFADHAEWIYALYLRGWDGSEEEVTLVKEWPTGLWAQGAIPWVEAAMLVQAWRKAQRKHTTFLEWKEDQE